MKTLKNNYFTVDLFDCQVHAIFDKNWKSVAIKYAKEELGKNDYDPEFSIAVAMHHFINHKPRYCMFFPKNPPAQDVYHECMHVLVWMIIDFGLSFDADNQEHIAYLSGYIINETFKLKNKRKRK